MTRHRHGKEIAIGLGAAVGAAFAVGVAAPAPAGAEVIEDVLDQVRAGRLGPPGDAVLVIAADPGAATVDVVGKPA